MTNRSQKPKAFDVLYFMTLSMSLFVVPVIVYRYVDETSSLIALGVILFLLLDFYFRHKIQEHKRKRYLALKKEEKQILADFRLNNRK